MHYECTNGSKQADNQFLGGLLNMAGTLGAAYIGKPGATPAAGTT